MTDFDDTILEFSAGGTFEITRRNKGSVVKGRQVPGTSFTVTSAMSIQPMSGRDLQRLPEGVRTKEWLVAFSPVAIYAGNSLYEPDLVTYKGEAFEVSTVEDWSDHAGFWKATMVKVPR